MALSFKLSITSSPCRTAGNSAGKCLRADNKNGAPVELVTCTGGNDQEWTWDGGLVTLYNGAKCLDVVDGSNANGEASSLD
jgi:hypothetical protein